jgi:hypothetical protein
MPARLTRRKLGRDAGLAAAALVERSIFNQAQAAAQQTNNLIERPVVVVPGILGTKLINGTGDVVWGDRTSLLHFGRLDRPPASSQPQLRPAGLLDEIRMLGPFWTIHFYDDLLTQLRGLGYEDGKSLFVFTYDWRDSNFDTSRRFAAWVNQKPDLIRGRFDVLAHSMGGIVTKIWLLQEGGASLVNQVIYMGTPFRGSMNALATLSDGWGDFVNLIAGDLDQIRSTMLSFPSIYELFPSYDGSCRFGTQTSFDRFDIFDPKIWLRFGHSGSCRPGPPAIGGPGAVSRR